MRTVIEQLLSNLSIAMYGNKGMQNYVAPMAQSPAAERHSGGRGSG
jgi:hypothetical protein